MAANALAPLEPYKSSQDINCYLQRFENYCVVSKIVPPEPVPPLQEGATAAQITAYNERVAAFHERERQYVEKKRATLLWVIGSEVYEVLNGLCRQNTTPEQKSFQELTDMLKKKYKPAGSIATWHTQFEARIQRSDESLDDFVIAVQRLANRCGFGDYYDTMLKMKIVNGVYSQSNRRKLLERNPVDYDAAVKLAGELYDLDQQFAVAQETYVEKVNKLVVTQGGKRSFNNSSSGAGTSNKFRSAQPQGGGKTQKPPPTPAGKYQGKGGSQHKSGWRLPQGVCYRCGRWHSPDSCRVAEWTCRKCQVKGHRERMCAAEAVLHLDEDEPPDSDDNSSGEDDDITVNLNHSVMKKVISAPSLNEMFDVGGDSEKLVLDELVMSLDSDQGKVAIPNSCSESEEEEMQCVVVGAVHSVQIGESVVDSKLAASEKCNSASPSENPTPVSSVKSEPTVQVKGPSLEQDEKELQTQCKIVKEVIPSRVGRVGESGPLTLSLMVSDKTVTWEVDTGSKYSLMILEDKVKLWPSMTLEKFGTTLWTVDGGPVKVKGQVKVQINKSVLSLVIVEVEGDFTPLIGRQWLDVLWPGWRKMFKEKINLLKIVSGDSQQTIIEGIVNHLKEDFPAVFSGDRSAAIKGFKAQITLKPGAVLVTHKDYVIPFCLRDETIALLQEKESAKVLERVEYPKCASPVWPIAKPHGGIRIVVDFKRTINPHLMVDHYPLPRSDDILTSLAGAKVFVVLDLADAYQQLEVTEDSKDLLTINTLIGFFRFNRLVYGLANAAQLFQNVMEIMLKGIKNVKVYIDDVLIFGPNLKETEATVRQVLSKLEKHNVRVNFAKCQFFKSEINYLGHKIDQFGIHPQDSKIKAISEAKEPSNIHELKSYLGMVNYYSKFVPNLSTKLATLYDLLRDGVKWHWDENERQCFEKSKREMAKHTLLTHFDPQKQLVLITDASPCGISAVLAHRTPEGDVPIYCVSCSLSDRQRAYSQLEREALGIVTGVTRYHKFLYGTNFVLVTDNQALAAILNPNKGLPVIAHDKLVRYSVKLAAYRYTIEYRRSADMGPADALSRLPLPTEVKESEVTVKLVRELPLNVELLQAETKQDPILSKISNYVNKGWPSHVNSVTLKPYFLIRDFLSEVDNCITFGNRVIVPKAYQDIVKHLLHQGHLGAVRTKLLARSCVWWPGLDGEIDTLCANCIPCAVVNFKPSKISEPWPATYAPWIRIHADFFHFKSKTFLIIVDSFSKYIEVIHMSSSTTAAATIDQFRLCFSRFGLPDHLVTDNGPPFASKEFEVFCTDNLVVLTHSPPYHPASNGQAERSVRTVKTALAKLLAEDSSKSLNHLLSIFLLTYRTTPTTTTKKSPLELMTLLKPQTLLTKLNPIKANAYSPNVPFYNVGQLVMYRAKKGDAVIPGEVCKILGKTTYLVRFADEVRQCSINQLNPVRYQPQSETVFPKTVSDPMPMPQPAIPDLVQAPPPEPIVNGNQPEVSTGPDQASNPPPLRRSQRNVRPPKHLADFV